MVDYGEPSVRLSNAILNGLNPVSQWGFTLIAQPLNPVAIVNKAPDSEVLPMKTATRRVPFTDNENLIISKNGSIEPKRVQYLSNPKRKYYQSGTH